MFKKLFIAVTVLILLPGNVYALGFGDITVFSKLNEPLKAHIEILDSESLPEDEVTVSNAGINTYRRANLPRPEAFRRVKFKTTKLANGKIIAVLTSKQPIKEPFITFIADLRWRNGRINREYTFLLDPPELVMKKTRPAAAKKISKPTKKAVSDPIKSTSFRKKIPTPKATVDHSAVIAAHVSEQTYTTRQADTLWKIAKRVKPDNRVTTYQTMQALFVLNPDAFINGNINLLKQNQTLTIPSVNEILQINGKAPVQETSIVRSQQTAAPGPLKKQQPIEPVAEVPTEAVTTDDVKRDDEQIYEGRLKIIPPTQELLDKPVANKEDLKLIKNALKTSIDTIELLHNENANLAAKIEKLTVRLQDLDSHNEKLNSQISEISSLLKNRQTAPITDNKEPATKAVVDSAPVEKPQTPVPDQAALELQSDIAQVKKPRSFVRELLTSPFITLALALIVIIILVMILYTLRKQNEKRKQRKQKAYIHYNEIEQAKPAHSIKPSIDNISVTETEAPEQPVTKTDQQKTEEEMDFFEYFEKKINAPDETPETDKEQVKISSTEPADSENETEMNFSLDISDEEIQEYEKHITQSYQQSRKELPDTALSEIDTYIAYGNYKTAEQLIHKGLEDAPENKTLHLKLFECYSLSNKRYEFMQHINQIRDILNVDMVLRHRIETIYQQSWDETLNINKFT